MSLIFRGSRRKKFFRCPVTPADLAAVLDLKLGIDLEHKFEAPDGRPIRIVDNAQPPRELL